jgi:outer membrane immunogenic protein
LDAGAARAEWRHWNSIGSNIEGLKMKKLTAALLLSIAAIAAVSGSARAADLMMPMQPAPVMAAAAPSGGWDGLYIGGNVGYSWGNAAASPVSASINGFSAGVDAGDNFSLTDSIVAGVEGDISWNDETGTFTPGTATYRINWDGAVLGRLGYDGGPFMPYVEAGVGFANGTVSGISVTNTHTGYVLGAGVQFQLLDQITGNVEYRYANYGSATYVATPVALTDNQIRLGLDYHIR